MPPAQLLKKEPSELNYRFTHLVKDLLGCSGVLIPETLLMRDGKFDMLTLNSTDGVLTTDTKLQKINLKVRMRIEQILRQR